MNNAKYRLEFTKSRNFAFGEIFERRRELAICFGLGMKSLAAEEWGKLTGGLPEIMGSVDEAKSNPGHP